MKALLDIGRTKLTIDLDPITLDPRIEVVRQFCSLLNDNRAGRSHYSTLLCARVEKEEPRRGELRTGRNEVAAERSVTPFVDLRRRPDIRLHAERVRNFPVPARERSPETEGDPWLFISALVIAEGISSRGSPILELADQDRAISL